MALKSYHHAWLTTHPDRTAEWLQDKLREGFDVHHLDGNHLNNDAGNLVLIEHVDHMRLHGMRNSNRLRMIQTRGRPRSSGKWKTMTIGREAYNARTAGRTWVETGKFVGVRPSRAMSSAKVYAVAEGKPWPAARNLR
ncbi:MAG: HNH endonuclease [Chelatococcus sp.]|nr:HNH endonuclease [Chelatococcus sp.]